MSSYSPKPMRVWDEKGEPVALPDPSYNELEAVARLIEAKRLAKTARSKDVRRGRKPKVKQNHSRTRRGESYRFFPSDEAVVVLRMAELLFEIRQAEAINRALVYWGERVGMRAQMAKFAAGAKTGKGDYEEKFKQLRLSELTPAP